MYTDIKTVNAKYHVEGENININNVHFRRSKRKNLLLYAREYCCKAGIHGVQYLAEEKRTTAERVWWVIFIIASVSACIYLMVQIYLKWLQSPVLVSFATKKTPFYDVPFPAITICPKVKIDFSKPGCFSLPNFMKKKEDNQTTTPEEERYAAYMHMLCDEELSTSPNKTIDFDGFYKYLNECEPKMISRIIFMNEFFVYNFDDLFKPILTEEGLCYSFNRLRLDEMYTKEAIQHNQGFNDFPQSEWHSEDGYRKEADAHAYPRRGLLKDIKYGLGVFLFEDRRNKDFYCNPIMQGYTVSLHIPSRPAKTREEFFFVPHETAALVPVTAQVTLTSERVRAYAPRKRRCFFPSERRLRFFAQYAQANCYAECLADHLLSKCGCVKFHMPRNATTKVCGPASSNCTNKFELEGRIETVKAKVKEDRAGVFHKSTYDTCQCLPMCNDVTYSTDPASFDVNNEKILSWLTKLQVLEPAVSKDPNIMTTFIMLYLKDGYIETTDRNELYGPTDCLSNFGGLLGLFTGFSMLSLIEIIYFLTLRICGNLRIYGHWTGVSNS